MENTNTEFDINKFAAEYVDKNIERIYNLGHNFIKGTKNAIKAKLKRTYSDYILSISKKYAKTKSFFIRDEQVFLESFYIPLSLSLNKKTIGKASVNKLFEIGKYFVIHGTAGCGKSILMKYLLIDTLKNTNFIPVFIELREINKSDGTVFELIDNALSEHKLNLDSDYFAKAFEAGQFIFFFDGFDEVVNNKRDIVRKNIFEIVQTYSKSNVLVSSRPDNEFSGWKDFIVLMVNNLEINEACDLITKLPYDNDIKTKFIVDLKKELFEKHNSFLSNPLLLSIMLLTYGQSANIPTKLNIFYNQAYEALYQRHDALKGGFQRDKFIQMDIQDYSKIFSAFSVQTYDKREFQFSRIDALGYLSNAKALTGIGFKPDLYLNDTLKSSCLLIEDGLFITYSHRSFQEYFTARFIKEADLNTKNILIEKYSHNIRFDSVLKLLLEMDPEMMEKTFILPTLNKFFKMINLKSKINLNNFIKYMNLCFDNITIGKDNIFCSHNEGKSFYSDFISFIIKNCGYLINWKGFNHNIKSLDFYLKYKDNNKFPRFKLSELSEKSELFKDLYKSRCFFSKLTLEAIQAIYKKITTKHTSTKLSIEELLLNK